MTDQPQTDLTIKNTGPCMLLNLVLLAFTLLTPTAQAEETPDFCILPYRCPTVARLMPQVGQRGTQVQLLMIGARLQQIEDVVFYGPGLHFEGYELLEQIPHDLSMELKSTPAGTAVTLKLRIDDDCPLGEHYLRVRTNDQLSEMVSFWVTPFPCVPESNLGNDTNDRTNGDIDHAQPVKLNTTVYGYHLKQRTMDDDWFCVDLQQGQRLTVEVWSSVLGFQHFGAMTDTRITVHGPDKTFLATVDDTSLSDMDPILNITVKQSGTYYIDIHQNMDYEGNLRHYAAHISTAPRPLITYPLGGQAGTTLTGVALGDVGGPQDFQLQLPAAAGVFEKSMIEYRPPGGVIPNLIQVADFPNVLEDGKPHFQPADAQVHTGTLPIAFNGRIEHEGQKDWFRFSAKKGQRYRVRTYAATLGSSLDPVLVIRPAEGTKSRINITADDSRWVDHDWYGNDRVWVNRDRMDPVVVFEADTDGDFVIGIYDAQRLSGPEFAYRVEFQPARNHAFIHFPTDYRESEHKRDRLVIPRGNTIEHILKILPGTGNTYKGGMEIVAAGLPDGVTFECPPLKAGQTLTQATLSATADAKPFSGLIDLKLVPSEPGADFSGSYVHNVPSTARRGGNSVIFNTVRRCALAVVEEAPFQVRVQQPKIGLAQNAMIDLDIEVTRAAGFDADLRVYAMWAPDGVTLDVPVMIPKGATRGTYRLRASGSVAPGHYPITLTCQQDTGGYRSWGTGYHFVSSPPIDLHVVRPYLQIELVRTAIERSTDGQIRAVIKTINPLPANAVARLVRLPKGVEMINSVTIAPGDTEVSFPIRATQDCLVGQYKEIGCEISITDQGQLISQESGHGTLRIDAERGR